MENISKTENKSEDKVEIYNKVHVLGFFTILISSIRCRKYLRLFVARCARFALAPFAAVSARVAALPSASGACRPLVGAGLLRRIFCRKDKHMNKAKLITNEHADAIMAKLSLTERLIFRIAVETGFRISDILHLKADIKQTVAVVERKTKKFRSIKLSDELYQDLLKYSPLYYPERYLFKSLRNVSKPYNRMTYHRRLKQAAKALQIDFSAHSTRKLYALNVFRRTGSIEAVQQAMNHKFVTTTATYIGLDLTALIKQALS
jgi:integrase